MLFYLFVLFVIVPLTELFLLFRLADVVGAVPTLGLVIVTGLLGSTLARSQGLRVFQEVREEMAAGRLPATALVDALMIFVAGALLLTPGILTDIFGFSLLVPWCRVLYRRLVLNWFRRNARIEVFTSEGEPPRESRVVDSYVVDSRLGRESDGPTESPKPRSR